MAGVYGRRAGSQPSPVSLGGGEAGSRASGSAHAAGAAGSRVLTTRTAQRFRLGLLSFPFFFGLDQKTFGKGKKGGLDPNVVV